MLPNRLSFLSEFDNFYQALVRDLKENKYNEAEFYLIITAKRSKRWPGPEGKRRSVKRKDLIREEKKR